jgi:hypothetical protein
MKSMMRIWDGLTAGYNLLDGFLDGFFGFSLCAFWGLSHGLPFPSEDK